MATTRQSLNLPYGHHGGISGLRIMSFGMFKHCQLSKARNLHTLLPVFWIAYSHGVPIFEEVSSSSG
jgi:hypothetical protein